MFYFTQRMQWEGFHTRWPILQRMYKLLAMWGNKTQNWVDVIKFCRTDSVALPLFLNLYWIRLDDKRFTQSPECSISHNACSEKVFIPDDQSSKGCTSSFPCEVTSLKIEWTSLNFADFRITDFGRIRENLCTQAEILANLERFEHPCIYIFCHGRRDWSPHLWFTQCAEQRECSDQLVDTSWYSFGCEL